MEERERLLATLPREERTTLELLTPSEWECLAAELVNQIDTETFAESPDQLGVHLAEAWDNCIEPTRSADILLGVLEDWNGELSPESKECVREEVRQNYIEYPDSGYRAYAASAWTAPVCLTEAESLEGDISLFAFTLGGQITSDERACLRQVAKGETGSLYGATDGIDIGRERVDHPAFDCFTRERLVEFMVLRFTSRERFGELGDAEMNCVHQTFEDAAGVRERLESAEERMAAHVIFDMAAMFGCLTPDQLRESQMLSMWPEPEADRIIRCLGRLFRDSFPEYRESLGPRMFGNQESMTPQEQATMDLFEARLEECLPDGM